MGHFLLFWEGKRLSFYLSFGSAFYLPNSQVCVDLEAQRDSKAEAEAAALKKLNEFVRRIVVQNSTPDWLPFAPGSSFWVPPHQNTAAMIANLIDQVTHPVTEEEIFLC